MKTYTYRGHTIEPKRDFSPSGYLDNKGKKITKGWVVVKDGCNVMPAACWFESVGEARHAIDVLIRVKGNADKFWEIMQPFEFKRVGQRASFQEGIVQKGRFKAIIVNFRVVSLTRHAKPILA